MRTTCRVLPKLNLKAGWMDVAWVEFQPHQSVMLLLALHTKRHPYWRGLKGRPQQCFRYAGENTVPERILIIEKKRWKRSLFTILHTQLHKYMHTHFTSSAITATCHIMCVSIWIHDSKVYTERLIILDQLNRTTTVYLNTAFYWDSS